MLHAQLNGAYDLCPRHEALIRAMMGDE
jgi:hypothetical protein